MSDEPQSQLLDALAKRHAQPKLRKRKADEFTLSLTVDQAFRRRVRLLAARDNLSIVDFIRAAVAAYEEQHGKPKDL